ncbi:hypothetical protein DESC_300021 [Desulfosarcina cetonica]|nr:hypothetical protein DESC_300021 [Desulfosarcina cetonica]
MDGRFNHRLREQVEDITGWAGRVLVGQDAGKRILAVGCDPTDMKVRINKKCRCRDHFRRKAKINKSIILFKQLFRCACRSGSLGWATGPKMFCVYVLGKVGRWVHVGHCRRTSICRAF